MSVNESDETEIGEEYYDADETLQPHHINNNFNNNNSTSKKTPIRRRVVIKEESESGDSSDFSDVFPSLKKSNKVNDEGEE